MGDFFMRTAHLDTMRDLAIVAKRDLSVQEKLVLDSQILDMRNSGSTRFEIAESLGLTVHEVEASIRDAISDRRKRMESTPRSEILMESVEFLRNARDVQMAEAASLDALKFKVDKRGNIVPKSLKISDRAFLARTKAGLVDRAVKAEKQVADLLVKTGVLPRQAEQIHITMSDMATPLKTFGEDDEIIPKVAGEDIRNRTELLEEIRGHLVVSHHLKDSSVDVPKDAIIIEDDDIGDLE